MEIFCAVGRFKKEKIALVERAMVPFRDEVAKEDGVLEFKIYRHTEDPTWLLFYEVYDDQEAFEKHRKTKHVDRFVEVLMESLTGEGVRGFCAKSSSSVTGTTAMPALATTA